MAPATRHPLPLDLAEAIGRYGWAVRGVFPTQEAPGPTFCYTVGLVDKGLPELLVFALPLRVGHLLLNDIAEDLLAGVTCTSGVIEHPNWPRAYLLPTLPGSTDDYACAAHWYSAGSAEVHQVVLPDANGRFPWESNFTRRMRELQPFLCTAPV